MTERKPSEWMLLPLKRYASFGGRSPRAEYWWFLLFTILVEIPVALVDTLLSTQFFSGIAGLALAVPGLAVSVRRLHDIDRTGWWVLAPLVPLLPTLALATVLGAGGALGGQLGSDTIARLGSGAAGIVVGIGGLAVAAISVVLLFWYLKRGTRGENRFGPDPLV